MPTLTRSAVCPLPAARQHTKNLQTLNIPNGVDVHVDILWKGLRPSINRYASWTILIPFLRNPT